MRCLPINPPCTSGLGEEQVNVGQLLKPLPPHSHVKLPTLQLIPVTHLCPLVCVETAAQHTQSVFLGKPKLLLLKAMVDQFMFLLPSNAPQDSQAHLLSDHLQYPVKLPQHPLVDQQPHGRIQDIAVCHHAAEKRKIGSLLISVAGCISRPQINELKTSSEPCGYQGAPSHFWRNIC